jgi:lysylphosphatidylglycerol synthetase-like protein (DUF2156 family)
MNRKPVSVSIALVLILVNAAFWLIWGLGFAFRPSSMPEGLKWIMVFLAIGSSVILAALAHFLKRRNRLAYYASLAFLAVIAVLSLTDEFGWLDLVSLLISLVPIGLLLKDRRWYLSDR